MVHTYLVAPPARAELLIDVEHRLRRKLADAASTIGRGIDVIPRLASPPDPPGAVRLGRASLLGELSERIARWARPLSARPPHRRAIVAAAESATTGWFAALDDGRVVGALDDRSPEEGESAARAAAQCDGRARPLRRREGEASVAECQRWLDAEQMALACGRSADVQELDGAIARRIATALGRSPRHERPAIIDLARRLRESLGTPRPLGAERALRAILDRPARSDDRAWMTEAVALARSSTPRSIPTAVPRIIALIAFGPPGEDGGLDQRRLQGMDGVYKLLAGEGFL